MKIAVLAVQGDFQEHGQRLASLGVDWCELRQRPDLEQNFDGLILPGGESTVQSKLLRELGMFASLREKILSGSADPRNLCRPDPPGRASQQ